MEVQKVYGNCIKTNALNTVQKQYNPGTKIITKDGKKYLEITYCIPKERHIGHAYVDLETGKFTDTGLGIEKMGETSKLSPRKLQLEC